MNKSVDPRMHSAEHILNQTMDRIYGCGRCVSAHVERKKSKCDYRFDRGLTGAEVDTITARVNAIIDADLAVTETFLAPAEARKRYDLGKVPDTVKNDIRIVKIGDYDACPCIGPHVGRTTEIGAFKITSTDFNDGILRIRFRLDP